MDPRKLLIKSGSDSGGFTIASELKTPVLTPFGDPSPARSSMHAGVGKNNRSGVLRYGPQLEIIAQYSNTSGRRVREAHGAGEHHAGTDAGSAVADLVADRPCGDLSSPYRDRHADLRRPDRAQQLGGNPAPREAGGECAAAARHCGR